MSNAMTEAIVVVMAAQAIVALKSDLTAPKMIYTFFRSVILVWKTVLFAQDQIYQIVRNVPMIHFCNYKIILVFQKDVVTAF